MTSRRPGARFNRGRVGELSGGVAAWSPTSAGGLVGWWRADRGVTKDASGNVSSWANAGSVGGAWGQSVMANMPHHHALSGPGGKASMHFGVTGTPLYFDTSPDFSAVLAGGGDVFFVLKCDADPGAYGNALWKSSSAVTGYYPYLDGVVYEGGLSTVRKTMSDPATSLNAWRTFEEISIAGEYTARVDDEQIYTSGTNTPECLSTWNLGVGDGGTILGYFRGHIYEILVYDRKLSAPERALVRAYTASHGS